LDETLRCPGEETQFRCFVQRDCSCILQRSPDGLETNRKRSPSHSAVKRLFLHSSRDGYCEVYIFVPHFITLSNDLTLVSFCFFVYQTPSRIARHRLALSRSGLLPRCRGHSSHSSSHLGGRRCLLAFMRYRRRFITCFLLHSFTHRYAIFFCDDNLLLQNRIVLL